LIVFTPKSLLRTRESFSSTETLRAGKFEPVLEDDVAPINARRLVLCSGKVYHDLSRFRSEAGVEDVAVVRLAQLYPLEQTRLADLARRHPEADAVWCQEEPQNMGAYRFLLTHLEAIFGRKITYAGRMPSASPATGSARSHAQQQEKLVRLAITGS
jgi:2-oxoglutarate dehydrogenase E1 component